MGGEFVILSLFTARRQCLGKGCEVGLVPRQSCSADARVGASVPCMLARGRRCKFCKVVMCLAEGVLCPLIEVAGCARTFTRIWVRGVVEHVEQIGTRARGQCKLCQVLLCLQKELSSVKYILLPLAGCFPI
jgi:hypothetical protein